MTAAGGPSPLLSVEAALARLLGDVTALPAELVPLGEAAGRTLAGDLTARLTQPPFAASAMDGYAVRAADVAQEGASLAVSGEAAAGRAFAGTLAAGEAVRIFTGAPLPAGADAIVIQEDTERRGERVTVRVAAKPGENIRPRGGDFQAGDRLVAAGRRLTARDLMLAAAGGSAEVPVARRPVVAILATGDELVPPGGTPGPDQIVSSIPVGLARLVEQAGGRALALGIARDTLASLTAAIERAAGADVLVTIGGASVGDHDLVNRALTERGLALEFWRIAMRPGKPLMYGRLGAQRVLGLPGNPVSATICAQLFLAPLIRALSGGPPGWLEADEGRLAAPLAANGPRTHYMRARRTGRSGDGRPLVEPLGSQDSSLVKALASADCLVVVPPGAPPRPAGALVPLLWLSD